jgi:ATP/maltotriose-dependent transcriptional regulator MalT
VVANVHLGMGAYYAGEVHTAEAAFEEALSSSLAQEWASVRVVALGNLAVIRAEAGELDRAARLLTETERAIKKFGVHESSFASRFWIAQGKLLEARGDLAQAEPAFQRAVTLARRVSSQLAIAHGLLAQAMLMRRRGRQTEARAHAREARQCLALCRDPGVLRELLAKTERSLQLTSNRSASPALPADGELSERELAVLRLMASELLQREIGDRLYISFNTVKSHSRTILRKLGVRSRADAVARGRDLGLL